MARTFRFHIRAEPTAQTLSRIIDLFAQRDVMTSSVAARLRDSVLDIIVDVPSLADAHADIIAQKMRSSVLVHAVGLTGRAAPESKISCK